MHGPLGARPSACWIGHRVLISRVHPQVPGGPGMSLPPPYQGCISQLL